MKDELEKLIQLKKQNDKKQRTISLVIILLSIGLISFIFYLTTQKQRTNENLTKTLDTTKQIITIKDSIVDQLKDTLKTVRKDLKAEIIECIGVSTGTTTSNGLPKYNFTIRVKERSLVSELSSVEYYFDDVTYHPKLKTSNNPKNNFSITIPNSWGCMNLVPVYLHFKNNAIDTVFFPMCDKAKIAIPKI